MDEQDRKKLHGLEKMMAQIDYKLLREQKAALVEMRAEAWEQPMCQYNIEKTAGIINLIDELQDKAVDAMGYTEEQVFGKGEE